MSRKEKRKEPGKVSLLTIGNFLIGLGILYLPYWSYQHRADVGIELTSDFSLEIKNRGVDPFTGDLFYRVVQESGGPIFEGANKHLPLGRLAAGDIKSHRILFQLSDLKNPRQGVLFLEVAVKARHDFLGHWQYYFPHKELIFFYSELSQDPKRWRPINSSEQVLGHKDFVVKEKMKMMKSIK